MPVFKLTLGNAAKGRVLYYDNLKSRIYDDKHTPIDRSDWLVDAILPEPPDSPAESFSKGCKDAGRIRHVRLQTGFACNARCQYCIQPDHTAGKTASLEEVDTLAGRLPDWMANSEDGGQGFTFTIRGGEPLVYWKLLRPFIEKTRALYPRALISITTNGLLLDMRKAKWLHDRNVVCCVSHDGPGQFVRGADPLETPEAREAILWLFGQSEKQTSGCRNFAFCSVLHPQNTSRKAILDYFRRLTGQESIAIGEGFFVRVHETSKYKFILSGKKAWEYRRLVREELYRGIDRYFPLLAQQALSFTRLLARRRRLPETSIACDVGRRDIVSLDFHGNLLTCHNVGHDERGMNGAPLRIGHIDAMANAEFLGVKNIGQRKHCAHCPVAALCRGGCCYQDGLGHDAACGMFYTDYVPVFSMVFKMLFGEEVTKIEGADFEYPADRQDVYGQYGGAPPRPPVRSAIPIRKNFYFQQESLQ
jgi:uncharacterized protein